MTAFSLGAFQTTSPSEIDSLIIAAKKVFYSDTLESRVISERSLKLARQIGYNEGISKALRRLGAYYIARGLLKESLEYYQLNLEHSLANGSDESIAKAYLSVSDVLKRMGDKPKTLENLLIGLSSSQKSTDWKTQARILNNIGNHYRGDTDFELAEKYYLEALNLRKNKSDTLGLVSSYLVLGNLHGVQGNSLLAKNYYKEGLNNLGAKSPPDFKLSLLTNLATVYYNMGQLDSATTLYEDVLLIRRKAGDKYSQTLILNNLTALAFEQKDFLKSIDYAKEGLTLAKEVNSPKVLSSLYYNLSDSYKALGDYKRSFKYYKLSDSIDYEITNKEKNAQLAEMQVKYDTAEKDRALAEQTLELEKASTQQQRLIAGVILLLLVISFVYWSLVRKRKSNRALSQQKALVEKREKEKALLLRELHHRVKNNFQVVSSLLNLQYYDTKDQATAAAIKSGQARVEAMSMIHRELYQSENITTIEMRDYIDHLIDNTAYTFNFDRDDFDLKLEISQEPLGVKYAIPMGVMINELITNSFKHAFHQVKRPLIGVKLNISPEEEQVALTVWDNGPGIPDLSEVKESSFGLELIQDLTMQLKGELKIGEHVVLKFPYEPQEAYVEG